MVHLFLRKFFTYRHHHRYHPVCAIIPGIALHASVATGGGMLWAGARMPPSGGASGGLAMLKRRHDGFAVLNIVPVNAPHVCIELTVSLESVELLPAHAGRSRHVCMRAKPLLISRRPSHCAFSCPGTISKVSVRLSQERRRKVCVPSLPSSTIVKSRQVL